MSLERTAGSKLWIASTPSRVGTADAPTATSATTGRFSLEAGRVAVSDMLLVIAACKLLRYYCWLECVVVAGWSISRER